MPQVYATPGTRGHKSVSSKMTITDGKTGESIREYVMELDNGLFSNKVDGLVDNIFGRTLSKLPYIEKAK